MRYRKQILFLLQQQRHLRVEELFALLKAQFPRVSVATIYRNLRQLEASKEAATFLHPDGSVRYELSLLSGHQHLVCQNCGTVIEITLGFIEELAANLKEKVGFDLHTHRLTMIGRCVNCQ